MSARQPIFGFRISAQTLKVCFYRPSRSVLYGFTLIELLVSIGIFAVITGFMLSNFRAGQKQDETRFAAEFAAGVIREALTRATAGATVPVCVADGKSVGICGGTAGTCSGGVCVPRVPPGWGASFGTAAAERVYLFADLNGDKKFDLSEEVNSEKYSASGLVKASAASPDTIATAIVFVPPLPDVLINGGTTDNEAWLILTHVSGGGQRTVKFNRISRRIEITNP